MVSVRSHMTAVVVADTPARVVDKLHGVPQGFKPFTIAGTPDQVVHAYASMASAGIDYFIAAVFGNDLESLDLLAQQVRPALEERMSAARLRRDDAAS